MIKKLFMCLFLLSVLSCGKKSDFYYYSVPKSYVEPHNVREIKTFSRLDILWVIDNSGSMDSYQQEVKRNTNLFMNSFNSGGLLDWKMGLISSDVRQSPFIGFNSPLDSSTSDPVGSFNRAVDILGRGGSDTELEFTPILNVLTRYPKFLRKDSVLAIIIVTDEREQSRISAGQFLKSLAQIKNGSEDLDNIVIYGVIDPYYDSGRKFEDAVNATGGTMFDIDDADYGPALSLIGKEIVEMVTKPRLYLNSRPEVATLDVLYGGKSVPSGLPLEGGYWIYNYGLNAIDFSSFDFIQEGDKVGKVEVVYENHPSIGP